MFHPNVEHLHTLESPGGRKTTVRVVDSTDKAILYQGRCAKAWIPKIQLTQLGRDHYQVSGWFWDQMGIGHDFLFSVPFDPRKRAIDLPSIAVRTPNLENESLWDYSIWHAGECLRTITSNATDSNVVAEISASLHEAYLKTQLKESNVA